MNIPLLHSEHLDTSDTTEFNNHYGVVPQLFKSKPQNMFTLCLCQLGPRVLAGTLIDNECYWRRESVGDGRCLGLTSQKPPTCIAHGGRVLGEISVTSSTKTLPASRTIRLGSDLRPDLNIVQRPGDANTDRIPPPEQHSACLVRQQRLGRGLGSRAEFPRREGQVGSATEYFRSVALLIGTLFGLKRVKAAVCHDTNG